MFGSERLTLQIAHEKSDQKGPCKHYESPFIFVPLSCFDNEGNEEIVI